MANTASKRMIFSGKEKLAAANLAISCQQIE